MLSLNPRLANYVEGLGTEDGINDNLVANRLARRAPQRQLIHYFYSPQQYVPKFEKQQKIYIVGIVMQPILSLN